MFDSQGEFCKHSTSGRDHNDTSGRDHNDTCY